MANVINSRLSILINDAQLSVLKVAQLENISTFQDSPQSQRPRPYNDLDSSKNHPEKPLNDGVVAVGETLTSAATCCSQQRYNILNSILTLYVFISLGFYAVSLLVF